jgi:hypothetical protein
MNAKEEFLKHIQNKPLVKCAIITFGNNTWLDEDEKVPTHLLKSNYMGGDWDNFLKAIDQKYDNGFGGQVLFGTIWYEDGTWSSRGEYDGSEWWEYNKCPKIPKELL